MFSDFPNLHPLVVHFPIVLILLSAALQVLLVFKDWPQLRWGTLIIMGVAFASALVASKIFHAHIAELPPLTNEIYQDHEKYAAYTLWISGLTFLLRGIGDFYHLHRRSYEGLVLASSLVAAVFLSLTGHRGAQLVYLEGVGPKGNLVMTDGHEHGSSSPETNHPMDHGAAEHQPRPGDATANEQAQPGTHRMDNNKHTGHSQLPASQKPGSSHADMAHMDRPMPADKGKGKKDMAGMDHSRMDHGKNKKPVADHQALGHGATPAPSKIPAAGHPAGMDHGATPAAAGHQQMGHTPGQGVKTDRYGRPLIDPTEPYDNNPAREQSRRHPKE